MAEKQILPEQREEKKRYPLQSTEVLASYTASTMEGCGIAD